MLSCYVATAPLCCVWGVCVRSCYKAEAESEKEGELWGGGNWKERNLGRKRKTTSTKQGLTVMMNNAMNNNKPLKFKGWRGIVIWWKNQEKGKGENWGLREEGWNFEGRNRTQWAKGIVQRGRRGIFGNGLVVICRFSECLRGISETVDFLWIWPPHFFVLSAPLSEFDHGLVDLAYLDCTQWGVMIHVLN